MSAASTPKNTLIGSLFRTIAPIVIFILLIAVVSDLHNNWHGFKIKEVEAARFLASPLPGSTIDTAWRNINSDVVVSGKIYQDSAATITDGLIFRRDGTQKGVLGISGNNLEIYTNSNAKATLNDQGDLEVAGQVISKGGQPGNGSKVTLRSSDTSGNYWQMLSNYGLETKSKSTGITQGYLYHDGNYNFGLLDNTGAWKVRVNGSSPVLALHGVTTLWGGGSNNTTALNFSWGNASIPVSADGAVYRYNGNAEIMVDDLLYLRDANDNGARIAFNSDNGTISAGNISAGNYLHLIGRNTIQATDSWLRLNQDSQYGSGVHTPGLFAPGSLNVGGVNGWGNPGSGNAWFAGSIYGAGNAAFSGSISAGSSVDAYNYHAAMNDSWFPYPGNGWNYFRGPTYAFTNRWYDENNAGYYIDPNGESRMNYLIMDYLSANWLKGGNVTIGNNGNGSDRQCAGCSDSITGMPNLWLIAGHSSYGNDGFASIYGQIVFRDANCPGPAGDGYGGCQVGYDVAELYESNDSLEAGDIVSSSNQRSHIQASNYQTANNTIGVVSTRPAILIDGSGFITGLVPSIDKVNAATNLDDSQKKAWMQVALNGQNKYPVALAGRVPVKVVYKGGDINFGDKITVSEHKGIGQKATNAAITVGTALSEFKKDSSGNITGYQCQSVSNIESIQWPDISEVDDWSGIEKSCFILPDGTFVGKIMVFVNTSTFDPEVYMTSTQGYTLEQSIQNGQVLYSVKDQNNNLVSRIMSLAELIVGKIQAGVIETKQLIVDGVDVVKKLNELNQKVDSQQQEIDQLKQRLQQLEQK